MRHIKPYVIFESESTSGYTVIGVYSHADKEAAIPKLREVGMKAVTDLLDRSIWNSYLRDNKLVILKDPAGKPLTALLPIEFEKNLQKLINGYYNVIDARNRTMTDPVELKKIAQALSPLTPDEDLISHIKTNPMDQDLLDGHPRRDELIQRSGVKDVSRLARMMRNGAI